MRFILTLFTLLLAATAFGRSDAAASPKDKRVALLVTLTTNPYIGAWASTFVKDAAPYGIKVTTFTTPYDAAVQSQEIDDAIAQKFDLILLNSINEQAVVPALTRAKAAGVPVILIVTPIQKRYENLFESYIGADHDELGRIAGENLAKALAEEGKTKALVAAITGAATQLNVQMRMAGFRAVLASHPGIEVVAEEDGHWQTAATEKIAGQLLVRFSSRGGLDGIFGMADNQATGVIRAIDSAGLKLGVANKGIVVVASNCMKDGMIHIKSGEQYSTATQIPTEEAEVAAKKVAAYFNGEKLKKYEIVKSYAVTKETLGRFATPCSY
jgi:ABC-type sugar transport system substrate-binding protein